MKYFKRKAISPLIASVLLVVFTIAISSIVVNFMTDYVSETTSSVSTTSSDVLSCAKEQIDIDKVYASNLKTINSFSDSFSEKNISVTGGSSNATASAKMPKNVKIKSADVMLSSIYNSFIDTYTYGADDQNTHNTLNMGPEKLNVIWSYSGTFYTSPSVYKGRVFACTVIGKTLYAFDELSGNVLWTYPLSDYCYTTPLVANDVVYVKERYNNVSALDLNGNLIWNRDYDGSNYYQDTFILRDNILYFVGVGIYAINATDGTQIWNISFDAQAKPAIYGDMIVVPRQNDGLISSFNMTTQENLWNDSTGECYGGTPVIYNSHVFLSDYCTDGDIFALNLTTGNLIWNSSSIIIDRQMYSAKPALYNGQIIVGSNNGTGIGGIYSLWYENGNVLWHSLNGTDFDYSGSPIVSHGLAYIIDNYGVLYLVNVSDNGTLVDSISIGGNLGDYDNPSVSDSLVFATNRIGIYAIGGSVLPSNITLDVGADGTDWTMDGKFNTTALNRTINMTGEIISYLSGCTAGSDNSCTIPLELEGATNGTVRLFSLNITYLNPIRAVIANKGPENLTIRDVIAFSKTGETCTLTPSATTLSTGQITTAEGACDMQCADVDRVTVTTACGRKDDYTAVPTCS